MLHTARVRHDWNGGGPLDLSVQQDEKVDILRVKNNPGGKWLARSPSGNCEFNSIKTSLNISLVAFSFLFFFAWLRRRWSTFEP